jgi:hypothetical protein
MIRFFGNDTAALKNVLLANGAIGNRESNVVFAGVHETSAS